MIHRLMFRLSGVYGFGKLYNALRKIKPNQIKIDNNSN